ncbi:UDP-glucose 4-epimerase family protein [Peristeroidobacter soli]|uniref:UDP-glucose 4-epimerase family protein n=1 Tax=Peristeroidobacter soli TaxID=2497877 RepID=UPI00101C581C|nr:SDR family oxidoreductase [Peristeroidobacter soli]
MILITGANGFVGSALLRRLAREPGVSVSGAVRNATAGGSGDANLIPVGDLSAETDWSKALRGARAVVHTAARVHVMNETARDPLLEFRKANVLGTTRLAEQAAAAGVRRFVFISSIKVHGEQTPLDRPFHADDVPAPKDPYGATKLEAEQALRQIATATGMEVTIIRPPLVYGPGVKANFAAMMKWLKAGVPLPLGAIHNRRSLVALDNLLDLIRVCIDHPGAANQAFLASDGADLSTTELLRRLGNALGSPARLVPVPAKLLIGAATLLGRAGVAQRLCGSLQVSIAKNKEVLDWVPPVAVDDALSIAATGFLREASG